MNRHLKYYEKCMVHFFLIYNSLSFFFLLPFGYVEKVKFSHNRPRWPKGFRLD